MLNFSNALVALKNGHLLQRSGWNGKGMFIYQTIGNTVSKDFIPKFASLPTPVKEILIQKGQDVVFRSSITMYTAEGEMQPGWLASQPDLLAEDWEIVGGA